MHVDDKFGPILYLNVFNLNTYFGCCSCQNFGCIANLLYLL